MAYTITNLTVAVHRFYDVKNASIAEAMTKLDIKDNEYQSYILTFQINGDYATTYANSMRRMFIEENDNISALNMDAPQELIQCSDKHFLPHQTYLEIENIPIAYDTPETSMFSFSVNNRTDENLVVMSKHLKLPSPQSHVIYVLSPGAGIDINHLRIKRGRGIDRAKFSACCNVSCEPVDVTFSTDIYTSDAKYLRKSGKISDEDLHKSVRIKALLKCATSQQHAKDFINISFTNLILRFQYILDYFESASTSSFSKITFTEIETETGDFISTLVISQETHTVTELLYMHIINEYDTVKKIISHKNSIEFECLQSTKQIYGNVCKKIIQNLLTLRTFTK